MLLRELAIRRKDAWEDKNRPLIGHLRVENATGDEIKISLSEEAAARIVEVCAKDIVEVSRQVATMLAKDLR